MPAAGGGEEADAQMDPCREATERRTLMDGECEIYKRRNDTCRLEDDMS